MNSLREMDTFILVKCLHTVFTKKIIHAHVMGKQNRY